MTRRTFSTIALTMVGAGVALRIRNALVFPVLGGYDAFGHFAYIWYVAATGGVPAATAGWSFFHPPLYYGLMGALWNALAAFEPVLRLRVGMVLMSLLGLLPAAIALGIARAYWPRERALHLLALGFVLFLPVHVYSAPFLGNEGLNAALCSVALLALLGALRAPSWRHAALLGVCLGLAMLTKFSALAVVAGAFATLGLHALHTRRLAAGARTLAIVAATMLAVCGWFYARNLVAYGTPFKMSRDAFIVRYVESGQPQARRGLVEYVAFDPLIFVEPSWPRGFAPSGDLASAPLPRAIRESVWTGVYANAWFDGFGGWVLPPISTNHASLLAGRVLLALGLLPSALLALGIAVAVGRLRRRGWDDVLVATLATVAALLALFVQHTRTAPIPASVKATYLMVGAVPAAFWFALGAARVMDARPLAARIVVVEALAAAAASILVFCQGLVFDAHAIRHGIPSYDASLENAAGVVEYAGGNRAAARQRFASSARAGWYLGYENLAYLEMDEGRPREALRLLRRAGRRLPELPRRDDGVRFRREARAEILASMGVAWHATGRDDEARRALLRAARLAPGIAEVAHNLGVLALAAALAPPVEVPAAGDRATLARAAAAHFGRALRQDPGLEDATALLVTANALAGECATARRQWRAALRRDHAPRRRYPVETGTGATDQAAIGRRRLIAVLPPAPDPARALATCGG